MAFQFLPEHITAIVRGDKTMTRRAVKEGEVAEYESDNSYRFGAIAPPGGRVFSVLVGDRVKWQVGRDYAVVPGWAKPGVWWQSATQEWITPGLEQHLYGAGYSGYHPLRIRILAIKQERLQDISEADAIAEGCKAIYFSVSGIPSRGNPYPKPIMARDEYARLWEEINGPKSWTPDVLVWVLSFEVVR